MQISLISFPATDGYGLYGISWHMDKSSKVAIIFIHGAGDSNVLKYGKLLEHLQIKLAKKDGALLAFNNRGSSYVSKIKPHDPTTLKLSSRLSGMAYEKIAECVPDIEGAIDYVKQRTSAKICLVGHSTGVNKIIYFMNSNSKYKRWVKSTILIAGGDDINLQRSRYKNPDDTLKKMTHFVNTIDPNELVPASIFPGGHPVSFYGLVELLTPGSDYDMLPFSRSASAHKKQFKKFSKILVPTTVIYGENDFGTIISPEDAVKILKSVRPETKCHVLKGADHNFTNHEEELAILIEKSL